MRIALSSTLQYKGITSSAPAEIVARSHIVQPIIGDVSRSLAFASAHLDTLERRLLSKANLASLLELIVISYV